MAFMAVDAVDGQLSSLLAAIFLEEAQLEGGISPKERVSAVSDTPNALLEKVDTAINTVARKKRK